MLTKEQKDYIKEGAKQVYKEIHKELFSMSGNKSTDSLKSLVIESVVSGWVITGCPTGIKRKLSEKEKEEGINLIKLTLSD